MARIQERLKHMSSDSNDQETNSVAASPPDAFQIPSSVEQSGDSAEGTTLADLASAVTRENETTSNSEDVDVPTADPPEKTLAQKIKDPDSKLPAPETGNWRNEWPRSVVKQMEAGAYNPKRPEFGGIDLRSIMTGTENGGKLKSRLASELEPARVRQELLGGLLSDEMSVLIGGPNSNANGLAIAIAKAIALGGPVLGVTAKPAPVLYVDPVRPEDVIAEALGADPSDLNNLLILGKGTTDSDIKNEIDNLTTLGVTLGLVIINEFGRIITKRIFDKIVIDHKTRYLVVLSEPKIKTKKNYKWDKSQAIDMTEREHVIYLEPTQEETVRLTIVKYGELVKDVAVDPKDNWKPLGKPKEGVIGKRQGAVLMTVEEAAESGIEPKDVAALLDISPNNAYQALLLLSRSEKIFKQDKRYYGAGITPKPTPDKAPA